MVMMMSGSDEGDDRAMFLEPEDPFDLIAMEDRSHGAARHEIRVLPPGGRKPNLDLDIEVRTYIRVRPKKGFEMERKLSLIHI